MRRFFVLFFAAATGYISLSQEMLWMRAVGYITGGEPTVFAHVLGFFLIGVAAGALYGEQLCARLVDPEDDAPVRFIGLMLLISAAFYYISIAGVAELMTWARPAWVGTAAIFLVVACVSFLLGGIFTVLCHYGARAGEAVGITVSRVYLANIIGSTLGPLLTGFVLMQYLSTDRIVLYLSIGAAALGAIACLYDARSRAILPVAACFFALLFMLHGNLYADLLSKFQYRTAWAPGAYKYLLENRSGIIAVQAGSQDKHGGPNWPDLIFGGGMYDGRFNIEPANTWWDPTSTNTELQGPADVSNYIGRAYMIAALHPHPTDILEIGLSSASWTRALANYIPVAHLTTIEINGGYPRIISHYPEQASVLTDPKVNLQIDDGRRWLNRHPDARFDIIVQNTTWHWRSEVTNLLSIEYLRLCRAHLNPGGVLYWNTTNSEDCKRTAAMVFPYVTHYVNEIAASDSPFTQTPEQIRSNLMQFTRGGREGGERIFQNVPPSLPEQYHERYRAALTAAIEVMSQYDIRTNESPYWRDRKDLWIITDDNMATEFKRARSDVGSGANRNALFSRDRSWFAFFKKRGKIG